MMKKSLIAATLCLSISAALLCGCADEKVPQTSEPTEINVTPGDWDTMQTDPMADTTAEQTGPSTEQTDEQTTPQQTEEQTQGTGETTRPQEEETTAATEETTEATQAPTSPPPNATAYEWYESLSGDAQLAFVQSFPDMPSFVKWYNDALEEYKNQNKDIVIGGDETIDASDLIQGQN